jgi:hypothetical protein
MFDLPGVCPNHIEESDRLDQVMALIEGCTAPEVTVEGVEVVLWKGADWLDGKLVNVLFREANFRTKFRVGYYE